MTLEASIGIILIISFLWALADLRSEMKKVPEVDHVRDALSKEKILFQE